MTDSVKDSKKIPHPKFDISFELFRIQISAKLIENCEKLCKDCENDLENQKEKLVNWKL